VRTSVHNGVECIGATVKLFGTKLDVFAYFVDGILVDTGPSRFAREFTDFFKSRPISHVVLTHHHEDHSGNAAWLEKQGLPVHIHPTAIHICREQARLPLYRHIFWGGRGKFSPLPLPGSLEGKGRVWQVIETPGHTCDHIALYSPELGILFTGDLFVIPKTRLILKSESIPEIMRSLRLLLTKDFHTLYCGHAGMVENGREMLGMKLDYLENLTGEVLELYRKGLSIRDIDKRIYSKTLLLTYLSGKEWSSENMIRSIIENE